MGTVGASGISSSLKFIVQEVWTENEDLNRSEKAVVGSFIGNPAAGGFIHDDWMGPAVSSHSPVLLLPAAAACVTWLEKESQSLIL